MRAMRTGLRSNSLPDGSIRYTLRGSRRNRGTLGDPYLYGIHDLDGNLLANTGNDDGGTGFNSRLAFTAPESGTYYIAAGAFGEDTGTYTVRGR